MLALAAVGFATTSLGNFLRFTLVGDAEMAARSLADGAFGAIVSAEPAPEIAVRYNDVGVIGVGVV